MVGFAVDAHGDVLIENGEISIITGDSLLQQKVWLILRTNLKEWFFDWGQGINMSNLIGKKTNADLVRYEIERGLAQVDSSFSITEFAYTEDRVARTAKVTFRATTASGEEAGGDFAWA